MQDELFSRIQKGIVDLDEQNLARLTEQAIAASVDPVEAIEKAYTVGIQQVGKLFEAGDYFLPELIQAAKMVKEAVTKMEKPIPQAK